MLSDTNRVIDIQELVKFFFSSFCEWCFSSLWFFVLSFTYNGAFRNAPAYVKGLHHKTWRMMTNPWHDPGIYQHLHRYKKTPLNMNSAHFLYSMLSHKIGSFQWLQLVSWSKSMEWKVFWEEGLDCRLKACVCSWIMFLLKKYNTRTYLRCIKPSIWKWQ